MIDLHRTPYVQREGEVVDQPEDEIWIRAQEGVHIIADKVVDALDSLPYIDLACIGAATVNNAVKAVAVARGKLAERYKDIDLIVQPYFSTIDDDTIEGGKTRVILRVFMRKIP